MELLRMLYDQSKNVCLRPEADIRQAKNKPPRRAVHEYDSVILIFAFLLPKALVITDSGIDIKRDGLI